MSTEQFDPSHYRFGKPNDAAIQYGKRKIVEVAGWIAKQHIEALEKLREEVAEADTATLNWVTTVSTLRDLRKIDDVIAAGDGHMLAYAVLAGAPAAAAARAAGMSPAAFKALADRTAARVLLVPATPKTGA